MKKVVFSLVAVLLLASVASAGTITVATFQDPTVGQSNPTRFFNFTTNGTLAGTTLNGSWTTTGLTLNVLGVSYANAQFTLPTMTATARTATERPWIASSPAMPRINPLR